MLETEIPKTLPKPHIVPLGDRIVVVPIFDGERKSDVGILIPDSVDLEPIFAFVVAHGSGIVEGTCPTCEPKGRMYPFQTRIGDKVQFAPWMALSVTLAGTEYYVISERDVLLRDDGNDVSDDTLPK